MALRIEAYALTDVGLQRDHNEDAFDILDGHGFYVLADGMGGHASGQVASRIAVDSIRHYVESLSAEHSFPVHEGAGPVEQLVSSAIQWSNERVFIESLKDRRFEGMGTTIVVAMADGDHIVLGHVGDSRIYRFRDGEVVQMTRDHSLLNHYIMQGRITTEEEARNFKEKNIIVKALGLKDYVEPEVSVVDRRAGDIFLLCSDGLSDQVDDWILANVLGGNSDDLQAACESLVRLANDAGGKDNCTVMLLKMENEDGREPVPSPGMADSTDPNLPAVTEENLAEAATEPEMPAVGDEPAVTEQSETDPGLRLGRDDDDFDFDDWIDDPMD